jgi:dTDP-4-amino-4,6-dideoxygalactose transaminase
MINVTKTFFPPIEEYSTQLKRIWENQWLTNRGELVRELEGKLINYLGVKHLTLTTNGTLPIQIAIKALGLSGEVITTPFSYVATTSAVVWENCTPVFVDIDPKYLTIDENKIEAAITDKTTAILATHVFGNPCNVEVIAQIAKKHNLKVIYDAAHCFGVEYNGQSIFNYGDISTCSFHATKIFHTGEGGCWITNNEELQQKMYYMHNFGHNGPEDFHGVGINAKMSELQAAMGLTVFDHMDKIVSNRKEAVELYVEKLKKADVEFLKLREGTKWNYHYFPIIFKSEEALLKAMASLNKENIFPRRYFYPSLNTLNYVQNDNCPISENISKRVLCLPLSEEIKDSDIINICKVINKIRT